MSFAEWICKKNEIASHVKFFFTHYGEPMDYFDDYLADVLKHDIDKALACWRDLMKPMEFFKHERIRNEQQQRAVCPKTSPLPKKGKFYAAYRSRT